MFWLFLTLFGIVAAIFPGILPRRVPPQLGRILGIAIAVFAFLSTSFVTIDSNSVGHLKRIYFGKAMPAGHVIAMRGENGPQAEVLPPGLTLRPFINIFYDVEELPAIDIPAGSYGLLTARDGKPLDDGEFLARGWAQSELEQIQNAEYFLTHDGQRGPQLTVLKPGKYRINQYLFDVKVQPAIEVHAGEVAVIKSNVRESDDCPLPQLHADAASEGGLAVPIVKKGCIGVWELPLLPNRYYLNAMAYTATIIPTRLQTWTYKGGYTRRQIDLVVGQDGNIEQREATPVDVPVPDDAADGAVGLTVEGWRVPLELRALVQVEPEDAPRVVASVGNLTDVEDKIITPAIRSVIRNETGRPPDPEHGIEGTRVLDLITRRAELERIIEHAIIPEGRKAGVTIKEVRFSDPVIPPELLLASQRKQLAEQLRNTYIEERKAQDERINTEKARATADQQDELVTAEIAVQVATQTKTKLQLEGEGEKLRLTEIAAGQKAQTEVLDKDRVTQLAMLKEILAAAKENPDIVKVPTVLVQGDGAQGLTGAAAVLGASNIVQMLRDAELKSAKP